MFEMVREVREVREGFTAVAAELDPAVFAGSDALVVFEELEALERLVAAAKLAFARRVAETNAWKGGRDRSAAHWLARTSCCSLGAAIDQLRTAEHIESLPRARDAFRTGELSSTQARHIADAASADPGKEAELVAMAEHHSVGEIVAEVRRVKAGVGDQAARHDQIRRSRRLRRGVDTDGAYELTFRNTPDVGADINAWLEPFIDARFRAAERSGQREPREAYAADALVDMLRVAATGDQQQIDLRRVRDAKIIVHVPYDTYLAGAPVNGQPCEIDGVGPVPVAVVDDLLTQDPFVAAVVERGTAIDTVTHFGRRPNALQMTALQARGTRCANLGCNNTTRLEADHAVQWRITKHTRIDELQLLCPLDHRRKDRHGWQFEAGTGRRRLLPPGHPDLRPGQGPDPPVQQLALGA